MRPVLFAASLVLLASPGLAETNTEMKTVHYLCERGAKADATYLMDGSQSLVVVAFEGRQMGFAAYDTTAGVRYLSDDKSHVWWDYNGEASLIWAAEGEEVTIYRQCLPQ